MAKLLYMLNPDDGTCRRFNGVSWAPFIADPLANWLDEDTDPSNLKSSYGTLVTWRGQLWARYFTNVSGSRCRMVPVADPQGTPSWDYANQVAADPSDFGLTDEAKVLWSNVAYYRGRIVWISWPEDGNDMHVWQFGDFGDGPELRCHDLELNGNWTNWESIDSRCDPHGAGQLFAHDTALFWAPGGSFGRHPSAALNRAFKVDITETGTGAQLAALNPTNGFYDFDYWDNAAGTPGSLDNAAFDGVRDGILGGGTVNGALYFVRANGIVDIINDLSYAATPAFDIRDQATFTALSSINGVAPIAAPAQIKVQAGDISAIGSRYNCLRGGRVDVTSGPNAGLSADIVGGYDLNDPNTNGVELALRDSATGSVVTALDPTDVLTIKYGLLAALDNSTGGGHSFGGSTACRTLEHDGFAYIVIGTAKASGDFADMPTPPLTVIKWDGTAAPTYLNLASSLSVGGLDVVIDEDSQLLHILAWDPETTNITHKIVNLGTFTEVSSYTAAVMPNSEYASAVKPGMAFSFSIFEPFAQIVSQDFDPVSKELTISSDLYSEYPGGLSGVTMEVQYNTGDGWLTATPAGSSDGLTGLPATPAGNSHTFVHNLNADEPGYIGPIQYRITTFLP